MKGVGIMKKFLIPIILALCTVMLVGCKRLELPVVGAVEITEFSVSGQSEEINKTTVRDAEQVKYLCQNLKKYDEAIGAYKAAIAAKPDYAEANSNLGLVYCTLARDYQDKIPSNLSNAQYKKELEVVKKFYREAKPYYETVRKLAPEKQSMWLNGLYSIYYMLNMGEELKEIETLMNN